MLCQGSAVTDLMGAAPTGLMRQGLSVKAHKLRAGKPLENRLMRGLNHPCGGSHIIALPAAQSRFQHGLFLGCVGAIAAFAKTKYLVAIGLDHGGIHPVERRP